MSLQEQQEIQRTYYNEALRCMDNAKEQLKNARKDGSYYRDIKYIKSACGIAYSATLVALDGFLLLKGKKKPNKKERKSIEYYQKAITVLDKKLLDSVNVAYKILHLFGYYDGIEDVIVIKRGFDEAYRIIEKIKPN